MTLIDYVISKLRTPKTWSDKCLKSPVFEYPSTSNVENVPKHCWNLHHSSFIIFINHWQVNWVGKSLCYWHAKSWDCLLTHSLPIKSILFLIQTIQQYQFRWYYLRNKEVVLKFLLHFWNRSQSLNLLKKKMTLMEFVFSKLRTPKT